MKDSTRPGALTKTSQDPAGEEGHRPEEGRNALFKH